MFCPECGAEYREGFARCADCDVDLVPELDDSVGPGEAADVVVVATFDDRQEAEVAAGLLESAGIGSTIRSDDAAGLHPHFQGGHGVELLVSSDDAEAASGLLSDRAAD